MSKFLARFAERFRLMGWRELNLLFVLFCISATLWLSVLISDEVENVHHGLDNRILMSLRQSSDSALPVGPDWITKVSIDVTALGSAPVLAIFVVMISGFLLLQRKYIACGLILFSSLTGTLLNQLLKRFFNRDRPDIVPHLAEFGNSSFPSGHSMLASIIYLTLAALLIQTVKPWPTRVFIVVSAFSLAFLVGLTRVVLGVHYPSDVLAGWTAGAAWALICWICASWLRRKTAIGTASPVRVSRAT